jgi:cytosine/adenosine deaminase-related metal-dependent hydrolase
MHQDNCRDKLPKFVLNYLAELEKQVMRLLKKSIRNGLTFIITNAGLGWVELTSMRFMPTVHREMIRNADKYGIKIVSAREMFEQQIPSILLIITNQNRWLQRVEDQSIHGSWSTT